MAITALELITRAFYNAQIVGKNFNNPTNEQINDGLFYLNNILAEKTSENSLNPYYQQFAFSSVIAQEEYFIENLIGVESLTFIHQEVRYTSQNYSRTQYFQSFRAETVQTLPLTYHLEREFGGARIFLYPKPDKVYDFTLWGQFSLADDTALQTDLSLIFDRFYTSYLEIELSARLCVFYGKDVPPGVMRDLRRCEATISKRISPPDLVTHKTSTLSGDNVINYAFVNLSNGWTTVSGK